MNKKEKEIAALFITRDEPFGPIDAGEIVDPGALELLFETRNKMFKALHRTPSIVVGRKGSGKTSYLRSAEFDSAYTFVVQLETAEVFADTINALREISSSAVFAETLANMWRDILNIGLMAELEKVN